MEIKPHHERILKVALDYWYITSKQVTSLLYKPGAKTTVDTYLLHLTQAGYLQRKMPSSDVSKGSFGYVYWLTEEGAAYLRQRGQSVKRRLRPSEGQQTGEQFLKHTIDTNNVLIAFQLFCRKFPNARVETFEHELELKRSPIRIGKLVVIPDAWIDLRIDDVKGPVRLPIWLEWDEGTMSRKRWEEKIGHILETFKGEYQRRFEAPNVTVMVVANTPERARQLWEWTRNGLAQLQREGNGDLFYFTDYTAEKVLPEELFLSKRWRVALDEQLHGLLEY